MDTLYTILKTYGRVKINESLAKHTTFKIGGTARYFIIVSDKNKMVDLLNYLTGEGVNYVIIGGGSNLLLGDGEFDGVFIKNEIKENLQITFITDDAEIILGAGNLLPEAVNLAAQNSLTGLEWGVGVPGTIGGAVRGNAGAVGKDISDSIKWVEVWKDGENIILDNHACGFLYRDSIFKREGGVVLRVCLYLKKGNKETIMFTMKDYLSARIKRMPKHPSAGSFFKNIKMADWHGKKDVLPSSFIERGSVPAGWMIEQAGGVGLSKENASVSPVHGNFIVNMGSATQNNVLELVEEVKQKVYNKFNIELEPEVQIIKF